MMYPGAMRLPVPKAVGVLLLTVIPLVTALALRGWVRDLNFPAVITTDSMSYIESARWFAMGQGIVAGEPGGLRMMTHRPPLYPVALAGGMMLGASAERSAFAINFWSLGISLFMIGLIVWRVAGALWAGAVAQAIATVAWEFLQFHLFVLSEALFVALMCGGIWALVEYQFRRRFAWLAFASVLLALSAMCRYAGLGIVLGVVVYLAWTSQRKVRDILVVGLVTLMPVVIWVGTHQGDSRSGIENVVGPVASFADIMCGSLCALGSFIAPQGYVWTKFWLGLAALGALAGIAAFRRTRLIGCIGLGYAAFAFASLLLGEHGNPYDGPIPVPIGLMLLIAVMTVLARGLRVLHIRPALMCLMFVVACYLINLAAAGAQQSAELLAGYAQSGYGFERLDCARSPLMARVAQLPADVIIASGRPDAVYFLTGRWGLSVPLRSSRAGRDDSLMCSIAKTLRRQRVVFIDTPMLSGPSPKARLRVMKWWFDLEPLASETDGTLYWVKERPENPAEVTSASGERK